MLKEFNKVMDYIEQHLTEDISGKVISKITGLSDYHFRRMFSYLAGMPLHEYIRNRRLASANADLINGTSVTVVAFLYGYQSPTDSQGHSENGAECCRHRPPEPEFRNPFRNSASS